MDGNKHLHVLFSFNKRVDTLNTNYFDIGGHHPNIKQKKGSTKNWIAYCRKEDKEPLTNMDFTETKLKKTMKDYMDAGAEEFLEMAPVTVCTVFKA